MKKIYMLGGTGMVASRVIELINDKFDITPLDEKTLDITNSEAVGNFFSDKEFDAIVNFAAFTNVDAAEAQKNDENGLAYKLNVGGPANLIKVCRDKGKYLVHISTDFVFSGSETDPGPYSEDHKLPESNEGIGWYGWTKNLAEKAVLENKDLRSSVIRYGYPFRAAQFEAKKDWARNLINLYNEQKLYPLFTDQTQSILLVDDLAAPLTKILETELTGIYHIASSDTVTPYEAGKYLLEKYAGKEIDLGRGLMSEFLSASGRTPRPRLGGLSVAKTQDALGLKFASWKDMIEEFVSQSSSG